LLLDVVVGKGAAILELLSGEDQALLVRGNALLVLDLGLDIICPCLSARVPFQANISASIACDALRCGRLIDRGHAYRWCQRTPPRG
ncbi:hypothetical protein COCSADRAFT_94378, partial [Bipolaris sorokiniana ND90Pr]